MAYYNEGMRARFLRLTAKKAQTLSALKREAERDGAHRVARRMHAVLLNHQEHTSGEIAQLLEAPRSKVSLWLSQYESYGWESLLEGHRSGRPQELTPAQVSQLDGIIDSGPVAYGFSSGVWTSPMIGHVIEEEFSVSYHPGHVKIARGNGLLRAAAPPETGQGRSGGAGSLAAIHLSQAKTADRGAALLFADEASFRQDPSLYQTWARRGHQPLIATTGQRNTQKIFGAVDLYRPGFHYQHGTVFEGSSYTQFLNRLASRYRGQEVF